MSIRLVSIMFRCSIFALLFMSLYLSSAFAASTAFSFPLSIVRVDIKTESTPFTGIQSGTLLHLVSEVNNTSDQTVNLTYITQIMDQEGYAISISFDKHSLAPNEKNTALSHTWTPEYPGNYTLEVFFVSDIFNNPAILSERQSIQLLVV